MRQDCAFGIADGAVEAEGWLGVSGNQRTAISARSGSEWCGSDLALPLPPIFFCDGMIDLGTWGAGIGSFSCAERG